MKGGTLIGTEKTERKKRKKTERLEEESCDAHTAQLIS